MKFCTKKAVAVLIMVYVMLQIGACAGPLPKKTMGKTALSSPSRASSSPSKKKTVMSQIDTKEHETFVSRVSTSSSSFNPKRGEEVGIYYTLPEQAKVTIRVFDPDKGLMKTFANADAQSKGEHHLIWDGKDNNGSVAPNEAYFFTIEAQDKNGKAWIYDPVTLSGGITHDISSIEVNQELKSLSYQMPEMGRVLVRIGIRDGGPLLRTLVDWEPRVAGEITEHWNGKDREGLIDINKFPKWNLIATYFTLPQNSIITYGNDDYTYREYKLKMAKGQSASYSSSLPLSDSSASVRPSNPSSSLSPLSNPSSNPSPSLSENISIHYTRPRTADYSPPVLIRFPQNQKTGSDDIPVVKDRLLIQIDLDEQDRALFRDQHFEIITFVDMQMYAEEEIGYMPYNWIWDLANVSEGEHVITVNISGLKDQIGVGNRVVKVVK